MSLLMDALKRAESNKQETNKPGALRTPGGSEAGLTLEPLGSDNARPGSKPLPDLASHLESLEADLADVRLLDPPPQRPTPSASLNPAASSPTRTDKLDAQRERDAVRNAFAVKQPPSKPSRAPLWLALGTLGMAAIGIVGYVFYTVNTMNRSSLSASPAATAPPPTSASAPIFTAPPLSSVAPTAGTTLPALPIAPVPIFGTNSRSTVAESDGAYGNPTTAATRAPRPPIAETDATPAIRLVKTPTEADSSLIRGHTALQQGDLELARRDYEQSLRRDPNNTDALLALAAIAHRQGRNADADALQQRAVIANPNDAAAQAAVLGGAATTADPQTTESRLKGLLSAQPESAQLNFALGNLYARQRLWPEAQQAFFNAVAADSDNPDYLFNLAVSLDQVRQPRLAGQHYRLALEAAIKRPAAFDREQVRKRLGELSTSAP